MTGGPRRNISSDHNAVRFAVRVEERSGSRPLSATRVYNTAKARWSQFGTAMDVALNERTLTVEIVKYVGSCDQLDEFVETYTEWGLKRDAHPKCGPQQVGVRGRGICAGQGGLRKGSSRGADNEQFCSAQDGQSLWDSIFRVISETGKNREDVQLKTDTRQVLGPDESATLLVETFFRDDRVDTDDPYRTKVRRRTDGGSQPPENSGDLPGVDPPFTGAEIKSALKAFHPRKAPGIDGFTSDICQAAIFLAMANKYLELGYFTRAWKVAAIKEKVENMLVERLQWYLMPKLQATQYGFTPQRGTEDALYDLMTHIYKELNFKKIILMVSLDIKGTFDNAWWPALETQLCAHNCPVNLHGIVRGYLWDQEVVVKYAGGECRKRTSKGCIQGSIASPTFWNLIWNPTPRTRGTLRIRAGVRG
ncbi:Retrovirus-related Pol polyprotein from type-1 retrotransposable element R1 [Eumeta japonica]|uniref:Retrovirus-related Pol polyprotein from type-1 retrotransposable element R1 n=1 Tax=Eumeta variegata TaxID=151549 RepID=A0A4C1SD52_EUMVA|nr:Retrovirus-related Pol polyprotein from type-1 retrotransposable element R1 [Eumeta japonica]